MQTPDYHDNSLVNLMATLTAALGDACTDYPPLAALGQDEVRRYRQVVLLVIDGMGHDHLLRHLPTGFLARHLRARITSVCPTTTASAITTLGSGKAPLQHGLTGWFTWLREVGEVAAVLPFTARGQGEPLAGEGVTLAGVCGWESVYNHFTGPGYALLPHYIADSAYSRLSLGRLQRVGYTTLAEGLNLTTSLLAAPAEPSGRRFIYAYWSELDHLGHVHGIDHPTSLDHLRDIDDRVAEFARSLPTDTLLLVTADHGMVDTDRHHTLWLEQYPELAACLARPLCGEPRLAFCYLREGMEARFLQVVAEQLAGCCLPVSRAEMLRQNLFGLGPAHPEFGHRIGDYALVMSGRYVLRDTVAGEQVFHMVGVHGGLSSDELYVPLIVCPGGKGP